MSEIKWFSNEEERLAFIRGEFEEFKPKVVTNNTKKESTKKGGKKSEVQTD